MILKELDEKNKIDKERWDKISNLEEELHNFKEYIIPYFSDVINKSLFRLNPKHKNELVKIKNKYQKLYDKREITKDEFIKSFQKEADNYYNKNADKISLTSIDDFINFRTKIVRNKIKNLI